jgi:hypothetical protein
MPINDPYKWDNVAIPPARAALPIKVFRYNGPGSYTYLPNIVCLTTEQHEGPDPGSAVFRYVMDPRAGGPYAFEQALSTSYTGPYVVEVGDRLCVQVMKPDGSTEWFFDGYPLGWGSAISGDAEGVALHAVGVAKRAFDTTIRGAYMRNADAPTTVSDVQTDLIARCNPRGKPNATPKDADAGEFPYQYPTFLDPLLPTVPPATDPPQRRWTLAMIARYLLFRENADQTYVKNPVGGQIDKVLVSREPITGVQLDPNDASTYTAKDIAAPDPPLTGSRWPTAIRRLTEDYGFGMAWRLTTTGSGDPSTALDLFYSQAGDVKSIYLDARGSAFDAAKNNIGAAQMERDISGVVNKVITEGGLERYQASFVLDCAFPSSSSDAASATALAAFKSSDPAFTTSDNFNKYRKFIFDETGEGHYHAGTTAKLTTVPSLDSLFGSGKYVKRRRQPIGDLFSTDTNGRPLKWRLDISTDYAGTVPGLWDGTGHWQHVEGGAALLTDQIGVRVNVQDPNKWHIGSSTDTNAAFPDGVVKAVQCMAAPDAQNPKFFLMLTCVVESDQVASYTAERQDSSPISWEIDERVDARDRLATKIIAAYTQPDNNASTTKTVLNDQDYLTAEAISVRQSKEAGVFEAEVEIPYFTRYYEIGDRIDQIEGRNLNLRTDGGGSGVMPVYPMVVSVRHDFSDGQKTYLTLSDRGMNHAHVKRLGTRSSRYTQPMRRRTAPLDPRAGFIQNPNGSREL